MCANIVERTGIAGSAKGVAGWFAVHEAVISYDHPCHAPLDHALNLDFVDPAGGPGARVGAELSLDAARELARAILAAVERAERYEAGA
jgi:hypothetical protein